MIRILYLGEIVGIPTVRKIQKKMPEIIEKKKYDFVIANADGASDGYGILSKTAYDLNKCGINVITCGDFVFNKKDVKNLINAKFVLSPYNLPKELGGKGIKIFNLKNNLKICVLNILGRMNFNKIYASDPFYAASKTIEKLNDSAKIIIVDFHGGATSEIQAMQWYLAGKVSLVAGSHLRVLTSDNRIINKRTAVISGLGYCGGKYSIGGFKPSIEIEKIKTGKFQYSKIENENIILEGISLEVDEKTGNAVSIDLFRQNISGKSTG